MTAALRSLNLNPKTAKLHCLVENDDGVVVPLETTPVRAFTLASPLPQTLYPLSQMRVPPCR